MASFLVQALYTQIMFSQLDNTHVRVSQVRKADVAQSKFENNTTL